MKHLTAFRVLIVLFVICTFFAEASAITITATLRDFNDTHPDFEYVVGDDRGFVATTIGVDQKPVYAGGIGTLTTNGEEAFNQWYNDVSGINQSATLDLELTDIGGGIYSYSTGSFFPIDDQLFGNQGRIHNYHFTLELHTNFTYQPGQIFSFNGDDDVFVFINDQLVIDLGGVHIAQSASVDLDTLGLIPDNTYPFDLFFAERHTGASKFRIDTSIVLEPNNPIVDCIDFDPDTLNINSCGQLVTVYIELVEGYDPADIDATTILLNGEIVPELDPQYGFVRSEDSYLVDEACTPEVIERMVKFDRQAVAAILPLGEEVEITITGELNDGTSFEGIDIIRVIEREECIGDFDFDNDVDGTDAANLKVDFGRSGFNNPCTDEDMCNGDFNCDEDVDGNDALTFKADFGRNQFHIPCPPIF